MANFKPSAPFTVPLVLLSPTYETVSGVENKIIPSITEALEENGNVFYGNFKSYGGTDRTIDGLYIVEDTANVETWYRPDIKSGCCVGVIATGAVYEIMGEPENINLRNQYLKLKLRRFKGGA